MITVSKFGTFWIVYCRECAWWLAPESWQEAEALRSSHFCPLEPVLRLEYVPCFSASRTWESEHCS
jgi:hypothetical protein